MLPEEDLVEVARKSAKDEATDSRVYQKLAEKYKTKNSGFSERFQRLAETEQRHYDFWMKYVPDKRVGAASRTKYFILLLRTILGTTFAIKYLEKGEAKVIAEYRSVAHLIPEADRAAFEEMLGDEIEHEASFANELRGGAVKYISFIILGLADAIVEISGIHAGSLGIYKSTELTGLAGLVAGAAASIAMASAAFAQSKQGGFGGRPLISAIATGVSYYANAAALALPYFLTHDQVVALGTSVCIATIIIASTSYYNSVISGSRFFRDFAELAGVMYGATVALYLFGLAMSAVFGITLS